MRINIFKREPFRNSIKVPNSFETLIRQAISKQKNKYAASRTELSTPNISYDRKNENNQFLVTWVKVQISKILNFRNSNFKTESEN